MSSFVRTIQKRIFRKSNVAHVPVKNSKGKVLGFRLPMLRSHIGYDIFGTPAIETVAKPARKPRIKKAAA